MRLKRITFIYFYFGENIEKNVHFSLLSASNLFIFLLWNRYSYSSGKIRAEKMSAAFPSAPADIDDIDHTKPGRNYSCTAKINPALSAKPILHYQQNFLPNLSPGATLK